jgi:hypothetical protein
MTVTWMKQTVRRTEFMETSSKIYIAGHRGSAGSAIERELRRQGFGQVLTPHPVPRWICSTEWRCAASLRKPGPEYVFGRGGQGRRDHGQQHATGRLPLGEPPD